MQFLVDVTQIIDVSVHKVIILRGCSKTGDREPKMEVKEEEEEETRYTHKQINKHLKYTLDTVTVNAVSSRNIEFQLQTALLQMFYFDTNQICVEIFEFCLSSTQKKKQTHLF